jgi:hypothetical protein
MNTAQLAAIYAAVDALSKANEAVRELLATRKRT